MGGRECEWMGGWKVIGLMEEYENRCIVIGACRCPGKDMGRWVYGYISSNEEKSKQLPKALSRVLCEPKTSFQTILTVSVFVLKFSVFINEQ